MTTLTHPTLAALLEAIRAEPEDDTVRLALADYLEEGDDPAWGELIRVQVEWARVGFRNCNNPQCSRSTRQPPMNWCNDCLEWNDVRRPLHDRSDDLLREHEARWRRGERCGRCEKTSPRGKRLRQILAEGLWLDSPCPTCHGTGWERWWLAEKGLSVRDSWGGDGDHARLITGTGWRHRVHFERGMIEQVDANLADILDADGKATEWALAVVRGEPFVRRFGVVDKRPDEKWWWWRDGDGTYFNNPAYIPSFLFDCFDEPHVHGKNGIHRDSEAAANRALAEAAWQRVREQA